jgi:hypothetical protein
MNKCVDCQRASDCHEETKKTLLVLTTAVKDLSWGRINMAIQALELLHTQIERRHAEQLNRN